MRLGRDVSLTLLYYSDKNLKRSGSNFKGKPLFVTQKPKKRVFQQNTNAARALSSKKWGP